MSGPNPIDRPVVHVQMTDDHEPARPPPTRDDQARMAMGLAKTMSPREACMRILGRRCAWHVVRVASIVAVLVSARMASAHSLDIGYLRIDGARVILDLDRAAAAQMLDAPNATPDALRARASQLAALTYARETPVGCTLAAPTMEVTRVTVRLTTSMSCPPGERTWRFPFVMDTKVSATFELLVKETATDRMNIVDRSSPSVTFGTPAEARASVPQPATQGRAMFLIGALLAGVMLAPLARFALRR